MSDRFREALTQAWQRIEERQWLYGWLGKTNSDTTLTYEVPGRKNFLYVTLRNSNGAQTTVPARNDAAVPLEPKLPVKLKLEKGVYVIYGRTARSDLGTIVIPPGYGARNFIELQDVPTSYTGATGQVPAVNASEDALEFVDLSTLYSDIAHIHALSDLDEVLISSPNDGDVLTYDGGTFTWMPAPIPAPTLALDDLSDVDITLLVDGYVLTYDGISLTWKSAPPGAGVAALDDLDDVVITGPSSGEVLTYDGANWVNDAPAGVTDHGGLSGLGDDDHSQYALLAGRATGQTFNGGTASGDNLTLDSTVHATKGVIILQPSGGGVGVGGTPPAGAELYVSGAGAVGVTVEPNDDNTNSLGGYIAQTHGGDVTLNSYAHDTTRGSVSRWGLAAIGGYTEIFAGGTGLLGLIIGTNTADPLILGTNNTIRMRIASSGEVGIGMATVADQALVLKALAAAQDALVIQRSSDTNTLFKVRESSTGAGNAYLYNGATLSIQVAASGDSYFNGGNVGFGDTTPLYQVDIAGADSPLHISAGGADSGTWLTSTAAATGGIHSGSVYSGAAWVAKNGAANGYAALYWQSNGAHNWYCNTGLTAGVAFTNTIKMSLSNAGVFSLVDDSITLAGTSITKAGAGNLTLTAAGAYNLTIPATGTAALLAIANNFTTNQTITTTNSPALSVVNGTPSSDTGVQVEMTGVGSGSYYLNCNDGTNDDFWLRGDGTAYVGYRLGAGTTAPQGSLHGFVSGVGGVVNVSAATLGTTYTTLLSGVTNYCAYMLGVAKYSGGTTGWLAGTLLSNGASAQLDNDAGNPGIMAYMNGTNLQFKVNSGAGTAKVVLWIMYS